MNKDLFTPAPLGPLTLENRFIRSATWDGLGHPDGTFSPAQQKLYRRLAGGGAALLTTGYIAVNPRGRRSREQNLLVNRSQQDSLAEIAAMVHDHDTLLIAQLAHCGGQARSSVSGMEIIAPSAVSHPLYEEELPREMTLREIRETLADFAAAACRAREAGCDGVQIHAAHGYLISQFLSPFSNRRRDDYGGDLEGRARFLEECYERIRTAVGEDFPITMKINGSDYLAKDGLTVDESLAVARKLAERGLDAVEVSGGNQVSKPLTPIPQKIEPGKNEVPFAAEIVRFAAELPLPVIAVGGIRSPATARKLRQQQVAFLALCRPLIREPELISRWREGDSEPSSCFSCNHCFIPAFKGQGIKCLKN